MMAVDSAPSASSRRSRFGIRKATKKASVSGLAPNARASTMSRVYPRTRLASVASPMAPTARTTPARTARSPSLTPPNFLTARGLDGRLVCRAHADPRSDAPSDARQEAHAHGQHQIRDQADEAKRGAPPAQPRHPQQSPLHREGRPRRYRDPGPRGQGLHPAGDPHARPRRDPGPDPPEYGGSEDSPRSPRSSIPSPEPRRRVAPGTRQTRCRTRLPLIACS